MLRKLGGLGLLGVLLLLAGIAVIASVNLYIAAGMGLIVVGIVLVVYGFVSGLLGSLGLGGPGGLV